MVVFFSTKGSIILNIAIFYDSVIYRKILQKNNTIL